MAAVAIGGQEGRAHEGHAVQVQEEEARKAAMPCVSEVRVTLASPEHAQICCRSLLADPVLEPRNQALSLRAEGRDIVAEVRAVDLRRLRRSLSAVLQNLSLTARTLDEFG